MFKVKPEAPKKRRAIDGSSMMDTQSDQDAAQEEKAKDVIEYDEVRELYSYKEHFGIENFYNILRCFYLLSNIPKDAENNPFTLYMDGPSAVRGFKPCFGIDIEEVALRFYRLFIQPVGKTKRLYKIGILRFYHTAAQLCSLHYPQKNYLKIGFSFYDYDQNGNIGSVDIINMYKSLPAWKIAKVDRKY